MKRQRHDPIRECTCTKCGAVAQAPPGKTHRRCRPVALTVFRQGQPAEVIAGAPTPLARHEPRRPDAGVWQ